MPSATICKFRPRTELRDLCAPSREDDERLLRVLKGFEDRGREVVVEGEETTGSVGVEMPVASKRDAQAVVDRPSPNNFVSPYLLKPLRSEAEVRAARSPRIPPAKGLAQCIAECTGIDKAFRALIGGGQ